MAGLYEIEQETSYGEEMTREQGLELLNEQARLYFGISGEEFIRQWDAGELTDEDACPEAVRVAMLIPFVR